jgi:hypothetical protein
MNSLFALRKFALLITVYTLCGLSVASAGEVEIVKVAAEKQRADWVFHVTLKHGDTGWEHYADAWHIVTGDGKELGKRTLEHPHIDEQPFTRSLAGVNIPADTSVVYVEAHDKVHGWSKRRYEVKLR